MGVDTGIAWTDHTFNPWWGCARVSPGCENCYAETWDKRYPGNAERQTHWGTQAPRRFFGDVHWNEPLKWNRMATFRKTRERVFCASMADVFEDRRDLDEQRQRLWHLILNTPALDWQLLTKRPENIRKLYAPEFIANPPRNVWLGTTVEDQPRAAERIPHLLRTPAAVRFLSCEPLLGPVNLDLYRETSARTSKGWAGIRWVIVGGESGPKKVARRFDLAWASSLIGQCRQAGVAVFMKQLGDNAGEMRRCDAPACNCGREHWQEYSTEKAKGGEPAEWPAWARVREFPEAG